MWLNPVHALRGSQFLFALIILALEAYVASWYNSSTFLVPCPSAIAFLIFNAVFSILVIIPYTVIAPRWFPAVTNKYVMLGAELVSALLWFGGFIAAADMLRKLSICRGMVCQSAKAGVVLGALEFILFGGTALFALRHVSTRGDDGRSTRRIDMHKGWVGKDTDEPERF